MSIRSSNTEASEMSQRLSFVLSQIASQNKPVLPVIRPPLRPVSEHHVVSVEAPSLPRRRAGACIVCVLCIWILATISLAVVVTLTGRLWGVDVVSSQLLLRKVQSNPSEKRDCTMTVYINNGHATRQQLSVALGLALDGIVNDEDLQVDEKENGVFYLVVKSCSESLFDALKSESVQNMWRNKLAAMKAVSFVVVRSEHVVGPDQLLHALPAAGDDIVGSELAATTKTVENKILGKERRSIERGWRSPGVAA